ncbi:tigger transposable element-derived protein 1 [Tiliqua scincoides]|uniref:tigger transposable element-derived protein 1 n=1 Tax=Tiliqua scincoides TaxID=71010 RepID=UPI003463081A
MGPKCGDTKAKRTHNVLTLQEKLDLIKLNEQGMSHANIGRKLGIPRTTVTTILKNKAKVLEEIKNATPVHTKLIRKRHSLISEMEKVLNLWIQDQISHNIPLSQGLIQAKALTLFNAMKAEKGEASAEETFGASRGWYDNFKKRSNLHIIAGQGEIASTDTAAPETFPAELEKVIEDGGYTKQQIFNVDETGLFWKKMPSRTFLAREERSMPGFKAAKDRLTLLLGANAAGDCRLKPMMIYHSENPRALKNYVKSSLPVHFKSNKKAWMTGDLFTTWFSDYFKPAVETYCKQQQIPFKILLLLDNAPSHPRLVIEAHKEIKVVFFPPKTTALLQPMTQGVTSLFKSYYLRRTFAKAIAAVDTADVDEGGKHNKLKAFWKGFNILDAIKTVRDAWDEVKETNLKGVWKKLIPSFMYNFEGFGETVEAVISDVVDMAKQLELQVETEDVRELLKSHDQPLTDEDLLQIDEQRRLFNEEESQAEDMAQPRELTTKELEEGIAKVEDAIAFWEKVDPNFERSSKVNRGLENQIACYKELLRERKKTSMRQTSLISFFKEEPPEPWPIIPPPCSLDSMPSTSAPTPVSSPTESPSPKRMRWLLDYP